MKGSRSASEENRNFLSIFSRVNYSGVLNGFVPSIYRRIYIFLVTLERKFDKPNSLDSNRSWNSVSKRYVKRTREQKTLWTEAETKYKMAFPTKACGRPAREIAKLFFLCLCVCVFPAVAVHDYLVAGECTRRNIGSYWQQMWKRAWTPRPQLTAATIQGVL